MSLTQLQYDLVMRHPFHHAARGITAEMEEELSEAIMDYQRIWSRERGRRDVAPREFKTVRPKAAMPQVHLDLITLLRDEPITSTSLRIKSKRTINVANMLGRYLEFGWVAKRPVEGYHGNKSSMVAGWYRGPQWHELMEKTNYGRTLV